MKGRYPIDPQTAALRGRKTAKSAPETVRKDDRPKPPSTLKGEALTAWKLVVVELETLGVLRAADRSILVLWCETWARYRNAADRCQADGMTIKMPNGYEQLSPWATILRGELAVLVKLAPELGLTPTGRRRLGIDAATSPQTDSLMRFIGA